MSNTDITPNGASSSTGWMSDVQRAIALILIGTFAIITLFATVVSIWPSATIIVDMAKTMQQALVNMALIALGFFFGNNQSKTLADAGQQKIVEKLTSTQPPTGGPVAPVPAAPAPWWPKLLDAEKNAITAAAPSDPRINAFITAATAGAANADDLKYLVDKGLLTTERAAVIQAA